MMRSMLALLPYCEVTRMHGVVSTRGDTATFKNTRIQQDDILAFRQVMKKKGCTFVTLPSYSFFRYSVRGLYDSLYNSMRFFSV